MWPEKIILFVQNFAWKWKNCVQMSKSTITTEPWSQQTEAVTAYYPAVSLSRLHQAFSSADFASRCRYWDLGHTSLAPVWVLFKSQLFICKIFLSSMLGQCNVADGSFWWLYQLYKFLPTMYNAMPCCIFNNEDCTMHVQHMMCRGKRCVIIMWLGY